MGGFSLCDFQFKNYFCIHLNVFRQHACFGILCSDGSGTLFYTTVTREMSLQCIKQLERINKGGPRFAEYSPKTCRTPDPPRPCLRRSCSLSYISPCTSRRPRFSCRICSRPVSCSHTARTAHSPR